MAIRGCLVGGFFIWLIGIIVSLGITGLIIYVIWHFISKFW